MSYTTLSSREKPLFQKIIPSSHFFLLCSCFHAHTTNATSQNIGGTDAWAVLHLIFLGDRPPIPSRSPPTSMKDIQIILIINTLAIDTYRLNGAFRTARAQTERRPFCRDLKEKIPLRGGLDRPELGGLYCSTRVQ